MHILLCEPYYGGSHRRWADEYQRFSRHSIDILSLPAQFWKWRMQGGAITMARLVMQQASIPDALLVSDMMNTATFRALLGDDYRRVPIALYFHESQLSYPQNSRQAHGWRYAFINAISALAADAVWFNSQYHLDAFFVQLPNMLKHFADNNELQVVDVLRQRSAVLPLGLDLRQMDALKPNAAPASGAPVLLWNHRWEEEKNPQRFVETLHWLKSDGVPFRVAFAGEKPGQSATVFDEALTSFAAETIQFGHVADFQQYVALLWQSDIVVSTAFQDFFGSAVAEAIYTGCIPALPDRLNYPYLLPEAARESLLYHDKGSALAHLLKRMLNGEIQPDRTALRQHIAQFDWSLIAPQYDSALEALRPRDSLLGL